MVLFSTLVYPNKIRPKFVIKKNQYDILLVRYHRYPKHNFFNKIYADTSESIKLGEAEDINFLDRRGDSLIKAGTIPGRIMIERPDREYRLLHTVIIHENSDTGYLYRKEVGRKYRKYYILRRY
jgi:hypothetical protein